MASLTDAMSSLLEEMTSRWEEMASTCKGKEETVRDHKADCVNRIFIVLESVSEDYNFNQLTAYRLRLTTSRFYSGNSIIFVFEINSLQ